MRFRYGLSVQSYGIWGVTISINGGAFAQYFIWVLYCSNPRYARRNNSIKTVIYSTAIRGDARLGRPVWKRTGFESCGTWRVKISAFGRVLLNSDVRCYECSVDGTFDKSEPFDRTVVKHGKLPVSKISSIQDDYIKS